MVLWLPCLQNGDYNIVLPNCRDINSGKQKVEELHQEGQALLTLIAESVQGEPIRGAWMMEEPACLMATAMPLSLNGLYEGFTWW